VNKTRFVLSIGIVALLFSGCGKIEVSGLDAADFDGSTSSDVSFSADILPTFVSAGCAAAGCHSITDPATTPDFAPLLAGTADQVHDSIFATNVVNISDEAASLLLLAPLTGSSLSHDAVKPFANTSDPTYALWLTWIEQGAANN
jgi:hypothetical protein